MKSLYSDRKFCLIGKIKGLSDEVKIVRKRIYSSTSIGQVNKYSGIKKSIGSDIRYHLLAYTFLKDLPYKSAESKCRDDNKPNPTVLLDMIKFHVPRWSQNYSKITLDLVKDWLATQ